MSPRVDQILTKPPAAASPAAVTNHHKQHRRKRVRECAANLQEHRSEHSASHPQPQFSALSAIGEDIMCSVCLDVMVHPRSINPCGHTFCGGCIPTKGSNGAVNGASTPGAVDVVECPTCRSNIIGHIPARTLETVIDKVVQVLGIISDDDRQCYHQRVASTPRPKEPPLPVPTSSAAPASSRRSRHRTSDTSRATRMSTRDDLPSSRSYPNAATILHLSDDFMMNHTDLMRFAFGASPPVPPHTRRTLSSLSSSRGNRTTRTATYTNSGVAAGTATLATNMEHIVSASTSSTSRTQEGSTAAEPICID